MKLNLLFLLTAISQIFCAHIQLLDITPEEAQKLITQQSLDLRYSKKLSEGPAAGRSYNGKIIDSNDYTEEIYDANQFHGQDGLGRSIFGYADNQQARLEARNINGEVRGQYRYLDPWGNDVEVQYWSDSLGFHQTDNRPKFDLQPVTETPEVKAARMEHERLWMEAARLNGVDVDTNGLYNQNSKNDDDLEGQVSNQNSVRYPILPYTKHISNENAENYGRIVDDAVIVDAEKNEERSRFARQQRVDEKVEEVTSEPRGFFYSFDYPVPFINDRGAKMRAIQFEEQPSNVVEMFARSSDDKGATETPPTEKNVENITNNARVSDNIRDGLVPAEEIHDVQTHPKRQKVFSRSVNRGRGSIKFKQSL